MGVFTEAIKRVFQRPVTSRYPAVKGEPAEGFRGKIGWNRKTCVFCMQCAINCPVNAIAINREKKEWSIDIGKCIYCGRCHDVCPTKPKSVFNTKEFELASHKKDFRVRFE